MEEENQLAIAFERLTIVRVAQELGIDLNEGAGQKSPFRADRKAGSFSVQSTYFKDHAEDDHKGGAWQFVELARPAWSKQEIAEFLIRAAGMDPVRKKPGTMRREEKAKREKLYTKMERDAAALPRLQAEPGPWSEKLKSRWLEGVEPLKKHAERLADERGWSVDVLLDIANHKTSLPLQPWVDEGNRRMWSWLVEKPSFHSGEAALIPVGYHGRYKTYSKNEVQKRWCYVPYLPQTPRTEFQQHLKAANEKLPPYPFILGDVTAPPHLVIILEGQFDAVSLACAFGWLPGEPPRGIVILGLRGVNSPDALLAAYGTWLRKHKPFVWILGDNDEAGKSLATGENDQVLGANPSFIARLRAQGCRVKLQFLTIEGCKDFNDVWRTHQPDMDAMRGLAGVAGCSDLIP